MRGGEEEREGETGGREKGRNSEILRMGDILKSNLQQTNTSLRLAQMAKKLQLAFTGYL